jgi:hypothetical protein
MSMIVQTSFDHKRTGGGGGAGGGGGGGEMGEISNVLMSVLKLCLHRTETSKTSTSFMNVARVSLNISSTEYTNNKVLIMPLKFYKRT